MFFVFLQDMMRNMPMKICAVLMALWYLMSIVGFDVHICHSTHHEPCHEHHAEEHHDCCCHHENTESEVSFSCCSDDYLVLNLPVIVSSHEDDLEEKGPSADFHPYTCHVPDICISMSEYRIHNKWSLPDSGLIAEGDVQSVLNIWRI